MADTVTAGNAADPTVPVAGATGGQPDFKAQVEAAQKDANEWKQRFSGMQGRYQQEHDSLLKAQGQVTDLSGQLEKLNGDLGALQATHAKVNTDLGALKTEKEGLDAKYGRLSVIAVEFPDLMSFEAKGLLPAGVGDELKAKLVAFKAALQAQGLANTQKVGETPPAPAATEATEASLRAEMVAANKKGDRAAYNKAYDALLALPTK